MFASLTVVGFIFAFAWVQQQFFNHLIEADLRTFKETASNHSSEQKAP